MTPKPVGDIKMSFPTKMTTTPNLRYATFGIIFPTKDELEVLRCLFHIDAQSRDSIPAEHTTNTAHYVGGQEILGTEV